MSASTSTVSALSNPARLGSMMTAIEGSQTCSSGEVVQSKLGWSTMGT
jgi:hypothetical protein